MMHNYRSEPPHCQRISKDSAAFFLTGFSLLRLKILHQSKKVATKRLNGFFKNILNTGKNPRKMLPVAATLLVTLDKTFCRCICWLQIKLQPLFTASISNAENVQNNKIFKRVNCDYHSLHNNWQPLTNSIATCKGNLIKVNASRALCSDVRMCKKVLWFFYK